ncbi:MAG: HIT family protein [Planctomycetia bacterium]|nr:HIT family protein [Planctomycetia bacterium]
MSSCPFCALAPESAGDDLVAWRTPLAFVVVPTQQRPRNRGHMLVLPRAHVTRLADTDAELRAELYGVVGRVSLAVRKAFDATGVTVFQNEAAPDQVLHHLHVHVVPRRAGDDFRLPAPEKLVLTLDERIAQARAMRAALA